MTKEKAAKINKKLKELKKAVEPKKAGQLDLGF
jgi:hypothetical protein